MYCWSPGFHKVSRNNSATGLGSWTCHCYWQNWIPDNKRSFINYVKSGTYYDNDKLLRKTIRKYDNVAFLDYQSPLARSKYTIHKYLQNDCFSDDFHNELCWVQWSFSWCFYDNLHDDFDEDFLMIFKMIFIMIFI